MKVKRTCCRVITCQHCAKGLSVMSLSLCLSFSLNRWAASMPVSTVFQHLREDAVPNPCWQTFYWPNSFSLTLSSNLSFSLFHSLFPVSQNTCSRYYVIIITSTLQRCHSTENKSDEKKKHTVRSNTAQAITHTPLPNLMEMSLISYLH